MESTPLNVLFISHHSHGIGHLSRSIALCEAISQVPATRVTYVASGVPIPGIQPSTRISFIRVPPASDTDLSQELAPTLRRFAFEVAMEELSPAVIVTEFFPFAPHRLADLAPPLVQYLRRSSRPPHLVCSLRDVPISDHSEPLLRMGAGIRRLLQELYSEIWYHSDSRILSVDDTPDLPQVLADLPLVETGYVVRTRGGVEADASEPIDLLVCAGGGWDGARVFVAAIEALSQKLRSRLGSVHFACGPRLPPGVVAALRSQARRLGIKLHGRRANLWQLMQRSRRVISMAGYNSTIEALSQGKPLLLLPRPGSFEQQTRARAFTRAGMALSLTEGESLALLPERIERLLSFKPTGSFDFDGARRSAAQIPDLTSLSGPGERFCQPNHSAVPVI
jgi:predicted glycosyltransferase